MKKINNSKRKIDNVRIKISFSKRAAVLFTLVVDLKADLCASLHLQVCVISLTDEQRIWQSMVPNSGQQKFGFDDFCGTFKTKSLQASSLQFV